MILVNSNFTYQGAYYNLYLPKPYITNQHWFKLERGEGHKELWLFINQFLIF
jgi:hypothetical protein